MGKGSTATTWLALQLLSACHADIPDGAKRCESNAQCRSVQSNLRYCRSRTSSDDEARYCFSSSTTNIAQPPGTERDGGGTSGNPSEADADATPGTDAQLPIEAGSEAGADDAAVDPRMDAATRTSHDAGDPEVDASEPEPGVTEPSSAASAKPEAYIKADFAQTGTRFGNSVALQGDTLVVGAPYDDSSETGVRYPPTRAASPRDVLDSGAAYVFHRATGGWEQEACLKVANGQNAHFARSVAIDESGERIVVGVGNTGEGPERVFLFRRDEAGRWAPHWSAGLVTPIGGPAGFGHRVAIHGDTLVVGAPWSDAGGAVFVYTLSDGDSTVSEPVRLTASNTQSAEFGGVVAVHGDTVVVAAQYRDHGDLPNSDEGAAFVYRREQGIWNPTGQELRGPKPVKHDNFGMGLAVNATYIGVGAPGSEPFLNDGTLDLTREDQGAVHLFRHDGTRVATLGPPHDGDTLQLRFGSAIALSAAWLLVGAPGQTAKGYAGAGHAFLYGLEALQRPPVILTPSLAMTGVGDEFGTAVDIAGDLMAIASVGDDSAAVGVNAVGGDDGAADSGAVHVFRRP